MFDQPVFRFLLAIVSFVECLRRMGQKGAGGGAKLRKNQLSGESTFDKRKKSNIDWEYLTDGRKGDCGRLNECFIR